MPVFINGFLFSRPAANPWISSHIWQVLKKEIQKNLSTNQLLPAIDGSKVKKEGIEFGSRQ